MPPHIKVYTGVTQNCVTEDPGQDRDALRESVVKASFPILGARHVASSAAEPIL